MKSATRELLTATLAVAMLGAPSLARAAAFIQCPGDTALPRDAVPEVPDPNVQCQHLTAGDGFVKMADGKVLYTFGFSDVTGVPEDQVLDLGIFRANFPAPTVRTKENQELYLTLTNVSTVNRPDLFDPHTVHYHGFPNAAAIFDGLPETAVSINQGASLTYYYDNVEPGTYMYHCHVEATEHMQMGMLGNLYVEPAQNVTGYGSDPNTVAQLEGGPGPMGYVYNDADGSTAFDVEIAIQISGFYGRFHDASFNTQALPFADIVDDYPMLNGRGYPDTVVAGPLLPKPDDSRADVSPQMLTSSVQANVGDRILLRVSNLGIVREYTLTALGLPMQVVGHGARLLRGQGQVPGENVYVDTNVVTLGGGESADIIIDTTGIEPGTYFLYTTNLNYLSNNQEDFGGMMAEIVLN